MDAQSFHLAAGVSRINLQNVVLNHEVTFDEVRLEGASWSVGTTDEAAIKAELGEVKFRIVISEPNLNRAFKAHLPTDFPLKNVALALFSEKAKITGNFVKGFISLPVAVETVIKVRNGVEVYFDLTDVKAGIGLPPAVVEVVEGQMNAEVRGIIQAQLKVCPIPIYVEEIVSEPGRLIVQGKTRLHFPLGNR